MSVLRHMRKMERGRVLYCLDYLMHRLNDEEASFRWLEEGCPDGTLEPRNILTEEQVADHADVVDSQDELDEMSALAVKILFSEMFPKAWKYLTILDPNIKRCLLEPEARCLV